MFPIPMESSMESHGAREPSNSHTNKWIITHSDKHYGGKLYSMNWEYNGVEETASQKKWNLNWNLKDK